MKKLNLRSDYDTSKIGLLLVNLSFSIFSLFVSTFLTAQIFVLSGESFFTLGVFSLLNFFFIFVFQITGGLICKKLNPIVVTRLSAVLSFLFLIIVLTLYEQLIEYYIILGLLWGSITGFYFSSYQFLIAKKSSGEKMLRFVAVYTSIVSVLQLIFPVTFGLVIYYGSFFDITMIILFVVIFKVLATFLIKSEPKIEEKTKLDFKNYFRTLKNSNHLKQTKHLWWIIFLTGFSDTITVLTTAFVMISFGTHLNLGILISVFAILKIFTSQIYRKYEKSRNFFYRSAIVFPIISVIMILIFNEPIFVAIFMGVRNTTRGFIFMEEEKTRLSATSYFKDGDKFIMESNLFYETSLASGAVLSSVLLIIIGAFYYEWLILIFLTVTVFSFSLHGLLIKIWQNTKLPKKD